MPTAAHCCIHVGDGNPTDANTFGGAALMDPTAATANGTQLAVGVRNAVLEEMAAGLATKYDYGGQSIATQEDAQLALDAINNAIVEKDKIRAHLGATQNRLENTVTNLTIQSENLQNAESRIRGCGRGHRNDQLRAQSGAHAVGCGHALAGQLHAADGHAAHRLVTKHNSRRAAAPAAARHSPCS